MDTEPALLAGRGDSAPAPAPRARARLALRLAGSGLLIATGAIHLDRIVNYWLPLLPGAIAYLRLRLRPGADGKGKGKGKPAAAQPG